MWALCLGTAAVGVLLIAALAGALPGSNGISGSQGDAKAPLHVVEEGAGGSSAAGSSTAGSSAPLPTPIKHVFLILMENEQTNIIYGQQPYETQLANTYAWGGDANNPDKVGYYAVCHPSAPNYLALTSGKSLQCGSDGFSNYTVNNLGNLLQTTQEPWIDYEESASVPCQQFDSTSGLYVVRHNPFAYYSDLGGTTPGSACEQHVVPIANLTNDYPYSQTPPAFTYIAPNILNDGHSSSAATGDYWLSTFMPKIIKQPWFSSTVVFIVYDEAYKANGNENFTGYDGLYGGPVYMVAVSPYTAGMGALTYNASHYNLLSTMEWLLGLPATGTGHDGTPEFPVLTSLFQPRLFGPDVDLQSTHLPAADLMGLNLAGDDLQGADFAGADLQGADLQGADLQSVNLAGANLQGANLRSADLAGAHLQQASLRGASLQSADLAGADLQGAQLQGASLEYADLTGATLTGIGPSASQETNFDGADLYHAVFTGAVCGSPNYITAAGATLHAIGVPPSCRPPL
jgi:phosphatidylinositol-3-phosphatase